MQLTKRPESESVGPEDFHLGDVQYTDMGTQEFFELAERCLDPVG